MLLGSRKVEMVVVVGVDGSVESAAALRWAAREALLRADELRIVHVEAPAGWADPPVQTPSSSVPAAAAHANRVLEEAAAVARDEGQTRVRTRSLGGHPAAVLLDQAADAELLVVGTRGLGAFGSLFLGSVSFRLAAHTPCPLVVVPDVAGAERDGAENAQDKDPAVVVGVAPGSPGADAVLRHALDAAALRRARLVLVAAYSVPFTRMLSRDPAVFGPTDPESHEVTAQAVADLLSRVRVPADEATVVEEFIVAEDAAGAIVRSGAEASLTVVGSRGRGPVSGAVLGSVSQHVLRHAGHPVVVVPTPRGHGRTGSGHA